MKDQEIVQRMALLAKVGEFLQEQRIYWALLTGQAQLAPAAAQ